MKTIEAKVHMLPTEDYTSIVVSNKGELEYTRGEQVNGHQKHLYITTDEGIKEGDWFIHPDATVPQNDFNYVYADCKKIIATTDPKLIADGVAEIPQSFIEKYCKAGGIDKVLVEVELPFSTKQGLISGNLHRAKESDFILRLNPDNTIIIHPVEEKMYSREEVIEAFKYAFKEAKEAVIWSSDYPVHVANSWIKEKLITK